MLLLYPPISANVMFMLLSLSHDNMLILHVIKSLLPFYRECFNRKSKARPRDFKQPPYPDAAAQILLSGIGTLVALSSEEEVRKHESDNVLTPFDEVFEARYV